MGCVLKISHTQQPVPTLQREITQPCRQRRERGREGGREGRKEGRKEERKKGRKKERKNDRNDQTNGHLHFCVCVFVCVCVTSQPALCGSDPRDIGLQACAGGGQSGGEGRRPLQAQSRTAIAAQKDTETPPSCDRHTEANQSDHIRTEPSVEEDGEGEILGGDRPQRHPRSAFQMSSVTSVFQTSHFTLLKS